MDSVNLNVNMEAKEQRVKCPQCGASLEPGSKFCSHCGTAIPDDVQKAHVKIEDLAELKRLELEEKKLQDEKEQRARKRKRRRIAWSIIFAFGGFCAVYGAVRSEPGVMAYGLMMVGFGGIAFVASLFR